MSGLRGRRARAGLKRTRTALALALFPGVVGAALLLWPPAEGLEKSGLDLLFLMRGDRPGPDDVRVVAIDDDSYEELGVDLTSAWPRGLHGELIRSLAREGARAIAFDVLFVDEGDPAQDEALRSAIEDTGIVVLGATVDQVEDPRFRRAQLVEPWDPFAFAAASLGEVMLPPDRDGVIRSAWLAPGGEPGLALAAYEVATGDRSLRSAESRVIDYYGPPRTIPTVSLYQALDPAQFLPEGYFRGAVVFVGLSQDAAVGPAAKDAFLTPFRGAGGAATFGVEIHATIAANLLEGRRIDLLPRWLETALVLFIPVVPSVVFALLGPLYGAGSVILLAAIPWTVGYFAFSHGGLWLPTVIPSAVQLPLAYVSSVVWYYLTTVRERERIKRAFSLYLSPEMTRQIAENPAALRVGGEEIVATAMFTDIKGFTSVSEAMTAPETAAMLNLYFSEATRHVFETGGTLVKYIGDAVFAIWGAPIRRPDHATEACRAALAMSRMQASAADPDHPVRRLVTRIGVHSGTMVVGNLGSNQRFDYTAIGDTVNLASRLEGLNKLFGTLAIVSAESLAMTDGRFVTRRLGRIRVVGREEPITVHELVGLQGEPSDPDAAGIARFEGALDAFHAARFAEAAAGFRAVADRRPAGDGPSEMYAALCDRYLSVPPEGDWDGVVTAASK